MGVPPSRAGTSVVASNCGLEVQLRDEQSLRYGSFQVYWVHFREQVPGVGHTSRPHALVLATDFFFTAFALAGAQASALE